jgi:hypothetical protein
MKAVLFFSTMLISVIEPLIITTEYIPGFWNFGILRSVILLNSKKS